jgi:hypothetical protein
VVFVANREHGCFLWLVSNRLTPILREPVEKVQGGNRKIPKMVKTP